MGGLAGFQKSGERGGGPVELGEKKPGTRHHRSEKVAAEKEGSHEKEGTLRVEEEGGPAEEAVCESVGQNGLRGHVLVVEQGPKSAGHLGGTTVNVPRNEGASRDATWEAKLSG